MSSNKRKCKFTAILKKRYPNFVKGFNDYDAKCLVCDCHVDVGNKGGLALYRHVHTEKHKKMTRVSASSKVTKVFAPLTSVAIKKMNAAAGTLVFHTIKHHQSYKSMECTVSLNRQMFDDSKIAKNLKCARTKTEFIIDHVIAPHTVFKVSETLRNISFISVAADVSNYGSEKLFPIMIQYYNWTGHGTETKILDLCCLPDENSETITNYILKTLEKQGLTSKCISFTGNNANVNFGEVNRNSNRNIYNLLRKNLKNNNLITIGCPAHVIHNSLHQGIDLIRVDIESIIMKIFNYFSIYAVRTEALKEFCDYIESNYQTLLNRNKTRWLNLFPAIERLLKLFPALKEYFLTQCQSPYILKTFFENPYSEVYLWFIHSLISIFQSNLASVEQEEISVLEIKNILESITNLLQNRIEDKFLPLKVKQLLRKVDDESNEETESIYDEFQIVYKASLEYLKKWLRPLDEFNCFGWMLLKDYEECKYEDLIPCIEYLNKRGVIIDDVKLYDQFYNLISFLKSKKIGIKFVEDHKLHEQWLIYFKSCRNTDCFSELLKICEYYFCISAHNANLERIFSMINAQWTKQRSRLNAESLNALILTQYNFKDMTCTDFYSYLLKNKELLSKIGNSGECT